MVECMRLNGKCGLVQQGYFLAGFVCGLMIFWLENPLPRERITGWMGNAWSGGDAGGFGIRGGGSICVNESEEPWPYPVGSSLLYHYGVGFKVNRTYVYEETGEDYAGSIEYVGSTLDSATGGLTGTDQLGAVWFGKIRIGNDGFLKSGEITFGTRSDDGSAL